MGVDVKQRISILFIGLFSYIASLGSEPVSEVKNDLLFFELKISNTMLNFHWNTVNSVGIEYFIVEQSSDGVTFYPDFYVDPQESTDSVCQYYAVKDDYELGGMIYYRLMIVNNDGTFSYSDIKRIYSYIHGDIVINTIDSSVELRIKNASKLKVVHADGVTLLETKILENCIEKVFNLDLPSGISYINIENSKSSFTKLIEVR